MDRLFKTKNIGLKLFMYYNKDGFLEDANPPCENCDGRCCRQKPHNQDFAVLLEDEEVENFDQAVKFASWGGRSDWVIPYKKGKCPYLLENRCTIYENRPNGCKMFKCTNGYRENGKYSFFLQDNPEVVKLIQLHIIKFV